MYTIDILVCANPDFSTVAISLAFYLLHLDKNNNHFGLKNWSLLSSHVSQSHVALFIIEKTDNFRKCGYYYGTNKKEVGCDNNHN